MPELQFFDYPLQPGSGEPLYLTVTIGYAQIAATSVSIDVQQYIRKPPADVNGNYLNSFDLELPSNAQLEGKTLFISSTVERIQAQEPNASVTLALRGGAHSVTYPTMRDQIAEPGATAHFTAEITLRSGAEWKASPPPSALKQNRKKPRRKKAGPAESSQNRKKTKRHENE